MAVCLTYVNSHPSKSMECTYEFPIVDDIVCTRMQVSIDVKIIEVKVKEKEEAYEAYEDALAKGNSAVMAKEKNRYLSIKIGNLIPKQRAMVRLELV